MFAGAVNFIQWSLQNIRMTEDCWFWRSLTKTMREFKKKKKNIKFQDQTVRLIVDLDMEVISRILQVQVANLRKTANS